MSFWLWLCFQEQQTRKHRVSSTDCVDRLNILQHPLSPFQILTAHRFVATPVITCQSHSAVKYPLGQRSVPISTFGLWTRLQSMLALHDTPSPTSAQGVAWPHPWPSSWMRVTMAATGVEPPLPFKWQWLSRPLSATNLSASGLDATRHHLPHNLGQPTLSSLPVCC